MPSSFAPDLLPLGFGCARLDAQPATQASRLLERAHAAGIRYFDTARMYTGGEAEGVLGRFAAGRRDELTITSKAGIVPPSGPLANRWIRRAAKAANRLIPGSPVPEAGPSFGQFSSAALRSSLETSLRELRTDHLDALLLHEVDEPDLADGRVFDIMREFEDQGRIRAWGTASTPSQTRRIVPLHGRHLRIVQTASTVLGDGLGLPEGRDPYLTITHSVLARALSPIMDRLSADATFRSAWTERTGVDAGRRERVAELLLAEALDANADGIVLFSTLSPARIDVAARVARDRPFSPAQIGGLRSLVAGVFSSPAGVD